MTRACTIALALSFGALAAFGCEDDEESPEDQLLSDLDIYETELNGQVDVICDCWQEFAFGGTQYTDKAACKTGQGEILPARRRCIDDAFLQDVNISQEWLNCVLPLETELTACANSKLSCSDDTSIAACNTDYNTGLDRCLKLPNSVTRDYEDCF